MRINMKILALDTGDVWIGSAISDELKITCKPYQTVKLDELEIFIKETLEKEPIDTVVVGYPKTIKGTESQQTQKVVILKKELEEKFNKVRWILWDERLSSKRAEQMQHKGPKDKEAKIKSHSIAAAFILQSYLDSLAF